MNQEKRAFTRVSLELPASLFFYQLETFHTASILNLSMEGCFVKINANLNPDEHCNLKISIGEGFDEISMSLEGTVVRSDPGGIGVQFHDLPSSAQALLQKLIHRTEPVP